MDEKVTKLYQNSVSIDNFDTQVRVLLGVLPRYEACLLPQEVLMPQPAGHPCRRLRGHQGQRARAGPSALQATRLLRELDAAHGNTNRTNLADNGPNELKNIMHNMSVRVFEQHEMCRHWCQMRGCRNLSIRGRRTCRLTHPAYIMGVDTLHGNICHKFLRGTCTQGHGCKHLHMTIGEVSALCTPAELADNWMIDETMIAAAAQMNAAPAMAAWLDAPTTTPASSSSTPGPGNLDKMD